MSARLGLAAQHPLRQSWPGRQNLGRDNSKDHRPWNDTYKFHEAVADEVILDLKYEARDVPQRITSKAAIDAWFENKTKGLNSFQRAVIRKRWATMEELMSAGERKQRIIASIIEDFSLKPRLSSDRGAAILVASSICDACHYFRLFQNTPFGQYCGIITSYEPNHNSISREPADSDERYKFDTYTKHVLAKGQTTKAYEDEAKRRFIEEPANLKLLIVVSKLLTGFDAPSCTYIYLDNELHDHGLFQAICRTNRLDGKDKDYGYIVDFKELYGDVQEAVAVYSSDELDIDEGNGGDNNVKIKNWLVEGKKQLDAAREALRYLCDPVPPPREIEHYIHYFCGDASDAHALIDTEALRVPCSRDALMERFCSLEKQIPPLRYGMTNKGQSLIGCRRMPADSACLCSIVSYKRHRVSFRLPVVSGQHSAFSSRRR
jgi:type I restriction enzyme R subunit